MSEAMQGPAQRLSRAERTTTSCGECRRRKQKCNQGQPCSNCARRFPQPVCEYKPNSRRPSAVVVPPQQQQPAFAVSLLPPSPAGNERFDIGSSQAPQLLTSNRRQPSPLSPTWPRHPGEDVGEITARWSDIDLLNRSPGSVSPTPYAWSTTESALSTYIIACEDGCKAHSDDVHDAVRMLRDYRPVTGQPDLGGWSPGPNPWAITPEAALGSGGNLWSMGNPSQDLGHIPMPPTIQDSELLTAYVKLISQFKASIDGNPDASNPYVKYHVPYCVQSPLLVHVAIYTAACFLNETGHIPKTVAMARKGYAINLLNEHIRSTALPSDEGITGVVQLIVDEWYWGDTNDLRAHRRGLREMIKLRGGFRNLGLHGLISKLAITSDVAIALSFEIAPFLRAGSEFEFQENVQVPLRLALNTPFVPSLVRFSSCDDALRIHPAVASILDDMKFLLGAVLALPENPSPKELQKVHTTSAWIHNRISSLPPDGPTARRPSAAASPASSSAAGSTPGFDARGTPEFGEELPTPVRSRTATSRSRSRGHRQHAAGRATSLQAENQDQWEGSDAPERGSSPAVEPPDYIYQAIRLAALMYCQAIKLRRPFSQIVSTSDFLKLWTTAWRVPLSKWRSLLGVFNWLLVPLVPSGKSTPHDRFVKMMVNVSLLQMGMDNWEIATGTMDAALRLQLWLGSELRESSSDDGGSGSEQVRRASSGESSDGGGRRAGGSGGTGKGKGKARAIDPAVEMGME